MWARSDVDQGPLRGFGAGAGVQVVSDRTGDDAGSFKLPGYYTVDVGLFYRTEVRGMPLDMQLNIVNVLDETYHESSLGSSRVFPGAPLSVYWRMGIQF